jgi:hypothetical protein
MKSKKSYNVAYGCTHSHCDVLPHQIKQTD